jgi:CBS domain-containing protein
MTMLFARQLMTPALRSLSESDSVVVAARRMRALGVSSIPVARDDNSFIGMLSERDIIERCVAAAINPGETTVGSLVFGPPVAIDVCQPADSTVLGLVLRQPQGIVAVLDNGVLAGVITVAGIASFLIDDDDLESLAERWCPGDPTTP